MERELQRRQVLQRNEALRLVVVDPPVYVVAELGARPEEPSRRHAWDRGARIIESYRQAHGATIAPDRRGLGDRPADDRRRRAYFATTRRLDAAKADLQLDGQAPVRTADR